VRTLARVTLRTTLLAGALIALLTLAAAGCGGDDDDDSADVPSVADAEHFPDPHGKTVAELLGSLKKSGLQIVPTGADFEPGTQRVGFGLFENRRQIADAEAVVYVARQGQPAEGPYPARFETLEVDAGYRSAGVENDPSAAKVLYVANVKLGKPGTYEVLGVVRRDGRVMSAGGIPIRVAKDSAVPEVGEEAPRISTPTVESEGGDPSKVDTRVPPGSMHEVDFADVVGQKPVVLLFATPALCQSRVCGPVVDIAEQVKAEHPDDAAWIAMEIYKDNEIKPGCTFPLKRPAEQCLRPQMLEYNLPTEPWLFTIDSSGRVAARLEGAFSAKELEEALKAATKG
jgi:hypothetical protein